jgi:hypothetical protein
MTETEWTQILEIERVLREKRAKHLEYLTSDAHALIKEGVFYDLDFTPTPGLVEEAQLRILEDNDQKRP